MLLDHDVVCPNTAAVGPQTHFVPTHTFTEPNTLFSSLSVTQLQAERCVPASTKNTIVEFEECEKQRTRQESAHQGFASLGSDASPP